jgi:hypothetical protein
MEYRKILLLLCALSISIIFFELFVFNQGFLINAVFDLQQQRYSIKDGSLYQFDLKDGKLFAENNDPNITFRNIDLPVVSISINCINTVSGSTGQVFYSSNDSPFSELHAAIYDASLGKTTLKLTSSPWPVMVSSLRFDLTDMPGDSISCSEFVINPQSPFKLSLVRLIGYAGLLLLVILIIFRNVKPVIFKRYPNAVFVLFFLALVFILGVKLMPLAFLQNVVFIVTLCILVFSFAMTYALAYLYMNAEPLQNESEGFFRKYKYEIALVVVILITTLPLLTEPYFYFDDYWGVGNTDLLTKQNIIGFARPIQILIYAVFDYIGIRNAHMFKWVFLPAVILYAIVLYRWLYVKTQDNVFSFFLASILSVFAPVMDLLGYTATSAVCYSILFSVLSVVCFENAYMCFQQGKFKTSTLLLNFFIAFVLLFVALLTYQIGTQIVFVFLSMDVYFNVQKKSLFKKNLTFLILFGSSSVFYLLFVKLLNKLYLVEITTNRSQIINSLPQVFEKIGLYKLVVTQSIMQVVAAFTGDGFILQRYRGYIISFNSQVEGNLLFLFVSTMILVAFLNYWFRTKNVLGLLSLFAFIPMAYFVFLILSENGYLVYYAFAHISLFMFYFMMGLVASVQFFYKKLAHYNREITAIKPSAIIAPLIVVCILISNYYTRSFYINFNSMVYGFIKYSLQTALDSGDITRIHVNGKISPINADVYSRFAVETALQDLEKSDADYEITFSGNKYFLERIQEEDYLRILKHISENEKQELDEIYAFDPTYGQYYIKAWPSEQDQKQLQQIFILAGVFPQSTSADVLIIDLTWVENEYFNHSER